LRVRRVAWVLADIVRMPAVKSVIEQLDPVTAAFAYVRLIGHRAEVEQLTKKFDRTVIDRTEEIRAVAEGIRSLAARAPVLVFVNNHYAGYAPATIRQLEIELGIPNQTTDDQWFFGGKG
jgi:uncharacterized protein YecE (DUF72 family)